MRPPVAAMLHQSSIACQEKFRWEPGAGPIQNPANNSVRSGRIGYRLALFNTLLGVRSRLAVENLLLALEDLTRRAERPAEI